MNPLIKKLMPAVLGIAVLALASAHGQFIVNSTGDAGRWPTWLPVCDTDWRTPDNQCTLRAAIQTANLYPDSNTIAFRIPTTDPGYDSQTGTYTISLQSALPDISTDMDITGPGADKLTVMRSRVSGTPRFRIFNVTTSGVATFSGFTIANGSLMDEGGAGIQNVNNGTVNITNCMLTNNYCLDNDLSDDKFSAEGGAIFNAQSGTVNVTNSTLKFNKANMGGGGISNVAGFINVSNSEFVGNTTNYGGGGGIGSEWLLGGEGVVSVSGSTFYQNTAWDGGGIYHLFGTLTVTNSTFYANMVFGGGGGIYNAGTVNLSNCTVAANFSYQGSGVYNVNGKIANVKSTIIALNYGGLFLNYSTFQIGEAPDVFGAFNSNGFNLIGKTDGSTGFTATTDRKGTIAAPLNPRLDLRGLRNNGGPTQTVALQPGSPAVDKATRASLAGTLTTDQRGFPRTVNDPAIANATGGDGTDIGAFELPAP
jgi:CSLREA domain-containing protein